MENKRNRKYFWLNYNEKITYQNLWDKAEVVIRGKLETLNTDITKEEIAKSMPITLKNKPKVSRRKEIIKNRNSKNEPKRNFGAKKLNKWSEECIRKHWR